MKTEDIMTSTTYPKSPLKTRVASIIWDNYRLAQTICKGANLCFEKFPKRRLFFQENRGQNLLHCKTKVESCSGFKFSLLERPERAKFHCVLTMSGGSPKWKRPSDVMKIHRKRKRLSQNRSFSDETSNSIGVLHDSTNVFLNTKSTKRKNPFSSENLTDGPFKRKKSETDDKLPSFNENTQAFFAILENANKVSEA